MDHLLSLIVLCFVFGYGLSTHAKSNIIVIVADDMGFNDVGFHGSDEIPTPNIDALAYNGVILNSHYTQALCTPSRSAFLTGKYPIHLGMQHLVILEPEPWGLPLNETLLPQHLKKNGYVTHAVGKWHLGFFRKEYTPTFRGFDTHYGYWQGLQDYYEHTVHATFTPEYGYDMRRNLTVDWDAKGRYSTTLFTEEAVKLIKEHDTSNPMFMYLAHLAPHTGNDNDPLQAPDEEIARFAHIADPERRIYAAMVSMLDKSVGSVVTALREKHMLENSIIVFMSDNGAQTEGVHANHGSNYPLRGMKNSAWEGASRGVAAIWSPLIKKPQRISNHLMHISDWLPTLFSAAGLDKKQLGDQLDGKDLWKSISEDLQSPRNDVLYNIDDIYGYGAYRQGDWKYMYGSTTKGQRDVWYGSAGHDPDIYTYDRQAIMDSPTGTALAGLITYQQIMEKNQNIKKHSDTNNFTINILSAKRIERLRDEATVQCKKTEVEDIPERIRCDLLQSPCLFNLREDPCETTNLALERPVIVANMEQALLRLKKTALPPRNVPRDLNADPAKWNNTWVPWQSCEEVRRQKLSFNTMTPLAIALLALACLGFVICFIVLVVLGLKKRQKTQNCRSSVYEETVQEKLTDDVESKTQIFEDREIQARNSYKDSFRTVE